MYKIVWQTEAIPYLTYRNKGKGRTKRAKTIFRYVRRSHRELVE